MTNEDVPQPDEVAPGGTPPPPPPPPPGAPTQPTPAVDPDATPTGAPLPGADAEPPLIVPLDVPSGPGDVIGPTPVADPTAVIGATTVMGAVPDDGLPPIPPADPFVGDPLLDEEEEKPWYQRPGPVAAIVILLLALAGLIAWLVFGGDDDDDVSPTASRLVLETVDQNGAAIERGFVIDVRGPAESETSFIWLRPASAPAGTAAVVSSGGNGRAAVDWEPDDTVVDPATWASTVTILETVPPGATPPSSVECRLERSDGDDGSVQLNSVVEPADPNVERVATYTFPNHQFLPGDAVTCRLVTTVTGPVTTVETTTATTEPAATVPETSVPETTAAPTTAAPTTSTSIDIPPPTPSQTLWDVIENEDELSAFRALVEDAGFRDALDDPEATFTIFAPTNDAIEAAEAAGILPSDPDDLTDLLLAHTHDVDALEQQELLLLSEIAVLFGGPQPVTAAPPTVGGARILFQVPPADNGVLYLIDEVLTPVVP